MKGLLQPTFEYISASEAEAVVNGKYRGDGRRLDSWIAGEPMMIDLPEVE